MKYSPAIQRLIDLFGRFPTVGPRTAARFVFYLLKAKKEDVEELISAISNLKKNTKICALCFNYFEPSSDNQKFCDICLNPSRDKTMLCVVEKETDLEAIEKTKKYKGLYFVLGGVVSTLRKKDIEKIRSEELKQRMQKSQEIKEVIIATNPTREGEATALYLERLLKPFNKKLTRLARGLPLGGELEYADDETLSSALEGRR